MVVTTEGRLAHNELGYTILKCVSHSGGRTAPTVKDFHIENASIIFFLLDCLFSNSR